MRTNPQIRTLMTVAALTATVFCAAAQTTTTLPVGEPARTVQVYGPVIPVITGRPYNVVSELCIESTSLGVDAVEGVAVEFHGINLDAVKSVKLIYSGTMSSILSRTDSYVMKDVTKKIGGGQEIWCDSDFVMEIASVVPESNFIRFSIHQALTPGKNYFYISLEVDSMKVNDFSQPFTADITEVNINGAVSKIHSEGTRFHRLGSKVRQHGDDGAEAYRIPGLVTTNAGTLIAVYDIRWDSSLDLQSNVDIGVSRSTDGGKTWEPMRVAMDMGTWGNLPQGQNGIGDPAVLVDKQTGDIFIVAVWTHGISANRAWTSVGQGMSPYETAQLMMARSSDDGKTWSAPFNITSQIKDPEWYLTLQGPGRGICMKDGTLVFAMQHIGKDRIPNAGIMYSKDHGETWHRHEYARSNTTESQVVEIEPGVLMLNMRDNRKTGRAVSITKDLGRTWEIHPSSGRLIEPVCMASLLRVKAEDNCLGKDLLIFSNPATKKGRHSMTIKVSLDDGFTWLEENSLLIDQESNWGYSCLSMIDEETVGILYECSTVHLGFQAIKLKDLVKRVGMEPEFLPSLPREEYAKGVSAPYCGIVSGNIFTAGGANFPGKPAVEGGEKVYYDGIFSLNEKDGNWTAVGKLPEPAAYGASFTDKGRLIIAGGNNGSSTLDRVYRISMKEGRTFLTELPSLPEPVEQAGFAQDESHLYLAGGINNGHLSDAVYSCTAGKSWTRIATLPEPSVQPVLAVYKGKLYYWCGFNPETQCAAGNGWSYDLKTSHWTPVAAIPEDGTATGAAAFISSEGKIVLVGGTDRKMFERGLKDKGEEKMQYMNLPPAHYGFVEHFRIYDSSRDCWTFSEPSGKLAVAGAGVVSRKATVYLLGGEIKPGVRTSANWKINLK